jgi:6-phosphogluconolactonase
VSNRGHDSIAVFSVGADGELTQIQVAPTGVHIPRGFGIDPTGHWLIAAGQESNNLTSLSIDSATGLLGSPGSPVALWAPVCIVFRR